ncbi:hypothetical protein BJX70DRAFT_358791 [Aspergillus crustosus]
MVASILTFASTVALASALPHKPHCFEFDLPIHVSLSVPKFNIPEFKNSYESTGFLASSVSRTANLSALISGETHINRPFNIHFEYCEPSKGHNGVLQVLSHGVGFDKSYWSFGNTEYNYIAAATSQGYATLSYDRLGVGKSAHANPYTEVQVPTQVAILSRISHLLRQGHLHTQIPTPTKLTHIGHSFGSLITNGVVAADPALSDGVVLTGFSHNTTWTPLFELALGFEVARFQDPGRFRGWDEGYLTWGDEFDNQLAFFKAPFFDTHVLKEAEKGKAPFAIAELLSFASVPLVAPEFTGPVLMLSGHSDLVFCGGDCTGIFDGPDSVSPFVFPAAGPFTSYIQLDTGHAVNLHHNASAAYGVILDFVRAHVG